MTSRTRPRLSVGEVPVLTTFIRGYLHQDALVEYGSARAAMEAFCQDASASERQALLGEAERVLTWGGRPGMRQVRRQLEQLGSSWTPRTRAQLVEMLDVLRSAT